MFLLSHKEEKERKTMKCPRCDSEQIRVMAKAPKDDAWEVYVCEKCCYSFQSTEEIKIHDKFKLDDEKIKNMQMIPPIPPLDES